MSQDVGASARGGLTIGQLWDFLSDGAAGPDMLDWAPDVGALTAVLLERSHAFRFVVSPPAGADWPPADCLPFGDYTRRVAAQWRALMDSGDGEPPEDVRRLWAVVTEHLDTPIARFAEGSPWELCEAVLLLHCIADEASAGRAAGASLPVGAAGLGLARGRELLVRTGSIARHPADRVAHMPKIRTSPVGITHRSLSRYSATSTGGIPAVWHRSPLRRPGTEPTARTATIALLPWPLRIPESDFVPVPGSVHRPEREPFGFFSYQPSERLDLDLVQRLFDAAREEVERIDAVVLPEGRLTEAEVDQLETVLARNDVRLLVTGLRPEPAQPDRFPANSLHIGVRLMDQWWHYRQNKHHRWFLDASQIESYQITGALHPGVKWWEAMDIPQRSVHFVELGGGITIAAVICEDLARQDGVAQLLREVGPTLVLTLLLDGPQLASRWTSRYAGVLADDPGSAVLTLTAFGMTSRSQPGGRAPSPVVAMWKDPTRGIREIPLESGAQGVLLKAVIDRAPRYSADGRPPADDAAHLYVAGVHQLRSRPPSAGDAGAGGRGARPGGGGAGATGAGGAAGDGSVGGGGAGDAAGEPSPDARVEIDESELSILTSWVEGMADYVYRQLQEPDQDEPTARGSLAERIEHVRAEARAGAPWRTRMRLPEPSQRLDEAFDLLAAVAAECLAEAADASVAAMIDALDRMQEQDARSPDPSAIRGVVRDLYRRALDAARLA